jgi:hypothetical protein
VYIARVGADDEHDVSLPAVLRSALEVTLGHQYLPLSTVSTGCSHAG